AVPQVAVGQLHDDDELAVDDVVALEREDERMADGLDSAEGLEFLFGAVAVVAGRFEVAEDELDGLVDAPGRLALPDLAKAAPAQPLDEPVAGYGFGRAFDPDCHRGILADGAPGRERRA